MHSTAELREAEQYFHACIPLTRAMGVRVVPDARGFAVDAPVALNHNHLHTAFGGSINAVATLAGYGSLWLLVRDGGAHLVVQQSSIEFLRPIRDVLHAACLPPEATELAAFVAAVSGNRKARIALSVRVEENGVVAARFTGTFVAVPDERT